MRIISGSLGGRQFNSPNSSVTHPMSDKIRGALFNILGDIEGLSVLDAFAGTGAIGFEAISRGAKKVTAIDSDRQAQKTLLANRDLLGLQNALQIVTTTAISWHEATSQDVVFDLVVCDPPYDNVQLATLTRLATRVAPGGLYILSWPADADIPQFNGFTQIERRSYGDAQLIFYRRQS